MLELKKIQKSHGNTQILKGINLILNKGSITSLVGASGAGKTTLLQIIGTLDNADKGEIYFDGKQVHSFSEKKLALFRNQNLGFVFQFHNLMSEFSAIENVSMPAYIAGKNKNEADEDSKKLLIYLGLENRMTNKPSELSGGEQQRVAVARAIINSPKLVLADEPTGNLDAKNSIEMFDLFEKLAQEKQITFLIATHNEALAKKATNLIQMKDGLIL